MWSSNPMRRRNSFPFLNARSDRSRASHARRRPHLEALEERQLLSVSEAFQFGMASTKPVSGYTLIAGTAYSSSLGYGWQGSNPIYGMSSGISNPSPLLAGSNQGYGNTFVANVPNGTYKISPTLGSYTKVMDEISVTLNGQQVASNLGTSAGQFISPTYQTTVTNGQLSVKLVDNGGVTSLFWIEDLTITQVTNPPTACAGPSIAAAEGSSVRFSGATASGGTGTLSYLWNFGDGTTQSGSLNPTHVYQLNGSYSASLTVTDSTGVYGTSSTGVTVNQVAPVVSLQSPSTATAGAPLSFSASATDANPLDQAAGFSYKWNFGDGGTATGANPSYAYSAPGTYTVSVTATSLHDGASSRAAATVAVVAGQINIDSNWLAQQGSGPYYLTLPGATYVLQTDVSVPGTAFIALASNITLDLDGHTVTYDNEQPIAVPDGGFEQGTGPTDIPGWDVSRAPGAIRAAAPTGMWGNWALELPDVSTTEAIKSGAIAIPQAGIQYAALITPTTSTSGATVALAVVNAVTGAVLASANSPDPDRGFSPVVQFTPTTTDPVQLVVTVAPPAGQTATVYLDDAAVERTGRYGVVASPSYWDLPPQLQTPIVRASAHNVAGFVVEGGSIVQGGGGSYAASDVFAMSTSDITVSNVHASAYGDDTNLLNLDYAADPVVANSGLVGGIQRISDRMLLFAAVDLANAGGPVRVSGDTITGSMDTGILVYRAGTVTDPITISGNTIEQSTIVTDGYGIVLNNVENFTVADNFIAPVNGRGLILDTFSSGVTLDGLVSGNVIEAQERPDLEYGATGLEAVAMTVRVFATGSIRDVTFTGNTFSAQTGVGGDWAAAGVRVSIDDSNTLMADAGLVFRGNTFQAVVDAIDPGLKGARTSTAWGLTIDSAPAGTGLEFLGDTFASDDISVNLGDDTAYESTIADVLFEGSTIARLSQGATLPYVSVAVGDWQAKVTGVWFIDDAYTGGAPRRSRSWGRCRPRTSRRATC